MNFQHRVIMLMKKKENAADKNYKLSKTKHQ